MSRIFITAGALILALCHGARADAEGDLQRLDWLIGTWERVDLPDGSGCDDCTLGLSTSKKLYAKVGLPSIT